MVNSKKIKERAAELGIRQLDIAKALGIQQQTVSQKINNVRPMLLKEAEIMADVLQIRKAEFASYFFSNDCSQQERRREEMSSKKTSAPDGEDRERREWPTLTLKGCGVHWILYLNPKWSEEQTQKFSIKLEDFLDQLLRDDLCQE